MEILRPRILYFDIDGTLVHQTFGAAKPALARGRFERAVRRAGFDRVVCVSDGVLMSSALASHVGGTVHDHLLSLCNDTIRNRTWFQTVELACDPTQRALEIDRSADWYFLDDFASEYLDRDLGSGAADRARRAGRILDCDAAGRGDDVLQWLRSVKRSARGTPRLPGGFSDPQSPASVLAVS